MAVSLSLLVSVTAKASDNHSSIDNIAADLVLSVKQQAVRQDELLQQRLDTVLPGLMARENIDMWLIISREYNEDPILKTLLPADWLNARRRTMLVFIREKAEDNRVLTLSLGRYDVGEFYQNVWDMEKYANQYQALTALIEKYQVKTIAVNESINVGLADGLVATDKSLLLENLDNIYKQRVISAEPLAVSWLETRTSDEIDIYRKLVGLTKALINDAFSTKVIRVGQTETKDLVWWLRQQVRDLGLQTWFQPSVSIQRKDIADKSQVIKHGDLLHVDFGISYLRLNTDIQQHAYVLQPEEDNAPQGLRLALKQGNQLQTLLTDNFKVGIDGNTLLKMTRAKAIEAGLKPTIYSHPIGPFGHNAGTSIGMWDNQKFLKGSGEWPLHANTAYAIELNVTTPIPEWQRDIRIMLEEDAWFDGDKVEYLYPRQETLILVK
ncbi:M24 family metallopeptidase [Thalassotalea sp. PS06]|nr:M24 family metallopeptidase [Thalassotalea sp. PS06]